MIIDLSFEKLKAGDLVKTKKGYAWQYIDKDTWKDLPGGLVWLPSEPGMILFNEYKKYENETKRLPTGDELKEAESHGIREIFDMSWKFYWSSTLTNEPYIDNHHAYIFCGNNGLLYSSSIKEWEQKKHHVKCVYRDK